MKIYVTTAPMRLQTMNSYIANDVTRQNIAVEPASRNIGTITNTACAVITSVAFIPLNRHVINLSRLYLINMQKCHAKQISGQPLFYFIFLEE
jgi:hypothetical protein